MTTENTQTGESQNESKGNQPTHVAKVRHGYGKKASYERIGVAWVNEDGSLYVKLYGTQVISSFALYEIEDNSEVQAEAGA